MGTVLPSFQVHGVSVLSEWCFPPVVVQGCTWGAILAGQTELQRVQHPASSWALLPAPWPLAGTSTDACHGIQ